MILAADETGFPHPEVRPWMATGLLLGCWLVVSALAQAQPGGPAGSNGLESVTGQARFSLEWHPDDRMLAADLDDAALKPVLEVLARKVGIRIRVSPGLPDSSVSARFTPRPLEEGLRKLLKSHDYFLGFDDKGVLEQLIVLAPGETLPSEMIDVKATLNPVTDPGAILDTLHPDLITEEMKKALLEHASGRDDALIRESLARRTEILNALLDQVEANMGSSEETRQIRESLNGIAGELTIGNQD